MNVLITGGCGFVGVNLTRYLAQRGYRIRILDNLSAAHPEHRELLASAGSPEIIAGDIRDSAAIQRAIAGMEAVVHLAASTSVTQSLEDPQGFWDINVNGTLTLLEACRAAQVSRFVFASSNAAVGEQIPPIHENMIPKPLSPYGASKLAGEALCSAYFHSFGMDTVALRFANVYGPCADHKSSVIPLFLKWAAEGRPLTIYGDGEQTRDFVHVDDISQAIHLSLKAEGAGGEIFQIASGRETSINALVGMISRGTGREIPVIHRPERKGEIRSNYSDIGKARRILGFEPVVQLEQGLRALFHR